MWVPRVARSFRVLDQRGLVLEVDYRISNVAACMAGSVGGEGEGESRSSLLSQSAVDVESQVLDNETY